MKRIFALISAFAVFFCACGDNAQSPRARTVTTVPGAADTALPRQIIFAVEPDADEVITEAARNFAAKANSLAKGSFTITVETASNPAELLKSGGAGFIFIDGFKAEALHPYFELTNERFRYSSYESFSIICNSARVLRRLSDASGLNVFAAFYTGSNVFGGGGPPDEILAVRPGDEPDSPAQSVSVLLSYGSGTSAAFDMQGIMSAELSETGERLNALYSSDKIVELAFDELDLWAIAAVPEPTDSDIPVFESERIVITRSFHSITPTWLILSPSLYDSLPPSGRAAIDEACAYIAGDVDHVYLKRERERIDELIDAGIEISTDFKATRNRILKAKAAQSETDLPGEKAFRDLLDRL